MEEDIKFIKYYINEYIAVEDIGIEDDFKFQEVIEQLIKEYKNLKEIEENHRQENGELRERVKGLEEEIEKINKQLDLDYVDNNYIPVSLVKEKIEEYKKKSEEYEENKKDDFMGFWQMKFLKACHKLQAYEELLEKRKKDV